MPQFASIAMPSFNLSLRDRILPDWKNYSDQSYSCPRGWHQGHPINGCPETPFRSQHYRIEGFLNWAPIMPRDVSLSDSRDEKLVNMTQWKALKSVIQLK